MNLNYIPRKIKIGSRYALFFSFLFLISLLNCSCKKYLDVQPSSNQAIIRDINDCQLLLNDYASMNTNYPSDGEASADDYYLNLTGYNSIGTEDQQLYIWAAQAVRASANPQWTTPYHTVYLANLIMENVKKLNGTADQAILDDLRGQCLFFRAYAFWQIAQIYAKPYTSSTASQDLGIPLRLSSDISGKTTRSTVQATYDQITGDLSAAAGILKTTSTVASRPNKIAAFAMLSRVYLSMENYSQAQSYANQALQLNSQLIDYNTVDTSSTNNNPFTRFNKEDIFHSIIVNNSSSLDPQSGNDNGAKIDSNLVASYTTNDLRRKIFLKLNPDGSSYRFTGNYEGSSDATFFNGLAIDELYLIRAECYARVGNTTAAMSDLNTLLRTRWITGTYTDMTAATSDLALALILTERRKELLMRDQRWTDLRRLNKDTRFSVVLKRIINGNTFTLPPNDPRYTLLIPNNVISLTGIQQNSR